jgi:SNF2 family DNA or RNA helicase
VLFGSFDCAHSESMVFARCQLSVYFCSTEWSTRAAAGQTLQHIAQRINRQIDSDRVNAPAASSAASSAAAAASSSSATTAAAAAPASSASPLLHLSTFSPSSVITHGTLLLASSGREYSSSSLSHQLSALPPAERIALQRREMLRRIGCGGQEGMYEEYGGVEKLIQEEDVEMTDAATPSTAAASCAAPANLSARERNKARRDAKKSTQKRARPDALLDEDDADGEAGSKRVKTEAESSALDASESVDDSPPGSPASLFIRADGTLTLMPFVTQMLWYLLDPDWETRHGAGLALRAVCMHLAGKLACDLRTGLEEDQRRASRQAHADFLSDCSSRLLCLLLLDRFGDYTGEQTSAPVRETAASVLALLGAHMDGEEVKSMVGHLREIAGRKEGDLRYGGFLGLKYVLAVRFSSPDALHSACAAAVNMEILTMVMDPLISALQDPLDDVRGMVADSLIAILDCAPPASSSPSSCAVISPQQQTALFKSLWASLRLCDDLASSTARILQLLQKVLQRALPSSGVKLEASSSPPDSVGLTFSAAIDELSPFLGHALVTVKLYVWQVAFKLMKIESSRIHRHPPSPKSSIVACCSRVIRLAYQTLMLEEDPRLHSACFDLLHFLTTPSCQLLPNDSWLGVIHTDLWILLFAPLFQPIPRERLVPWKQGESSSSSILSQSAPPVVSLPMKLRLSRFLATLCHRVSTVDADIRAGLCARMVEYLQAESDLYVQMACLVLCEWSEIAGASAESTWTSDEKLVATLRKLIDPKQAGRLRSPNTNSLLAQATLSSLDLPSTPISVLQLCLQPLLFTLENEANFALLQERCAGYVARMVCSLARGGKVKQDPSSNVRIDPGVQAFVDTIVEKMMTLACASLPAPAAAPHQSVVEIAAVAAEDVDMSADDDELLAMLRGDDDGNNEEEQKEDNTHKKSRTDEAKKADAPQSKPPDASPAIAERGGTFLLAALCRESTSDLFDSFPRLHISISSGVSEKAPSAYAAAAALQLLQIIITHIPSASDGVLLRQFLPRCQSLLFAAEDPSPIGHVKLQRTESVLVSFAERTTTAFMESFITHLLPILLASDLHHHAISSVHAKIRVLRLIKVMFERVEMQMVPWLPFLLPPVLSCMSDSSSHTSTSTADSQKELRALASSLFGTIMNLLPVEAGVKHPEGMSREMQGRRVEQRAFLRQLLYGASSSSSEEIDIPSGILQKDIELRQYQKDGVRWMLFLQKYHLHGALCDEMGVGKSGQAAVAMAISIYQRRKQFLTATDAASKAASAPLPSLILCPSTLVHHWQYEIRKFVSAEACPLEVVVYEGDAKQKEAIRKRLVDSSVAAASTSASSSPPSPHSDCILIMSYDSLRKDHSSLASTVSFLFLLLDEGHLIKNATSLLSKAIKTLRSRSRLVLTGTPLSNHVLELWSLVDFLLPGYLGEESDFKREYARPIEQARRKEMEKTTMRKKVTEEEKDSKLRAITSAGHVALSSLHRRVLPFFLRRTKSDVLRDLPPKVVQDCVVEMTGMQREMYALVKDREEEIARAAEEVIAAGGDAPSSTAAAAATPAFAHTFQALQYLRKLCSSPAHVLTPTHPLYATMQKKYASAGGKSSAATGAMNLLEEAKAVKHSAKLGALRELLVECGIGTLVSASDDSPSASSTKRKWSSKSAASSASCSSDEAAELDLAAPLRQRVLIFAQLKSTLDRVEQDLFNSSSVASSSSKKNHDERVDPDGFVTGSVRWVRLDGDTPNSKRFELVQRFNADSDIDCMLLTTSVGSLGLNLSGASTVIFLEHSYNPQQDLQAMDRAHRIGQKAKCVNVYRILCADTLEERIMSLQRFKLHVANSVVNADNASMKSMDTSQVLERLQSTPAASKNLSPAPTSADAAQHAIASTTGMEIDSSTSSVPEQDEAESMEEFLSSFRRR